MSHETTGAQLAVNDDRLGTINVSAIEMRSTARLKM